MSNKEETKVTAPKKDKANASVLLGAAFLMATSAIGPGFLTQTSTFTAQYLSSFAAVIVCAILLDVSTQVNVWRIIGVSGMRGQDIANKVLPGLGFFIAFLVALGGLAFNIGNVGGASLGLNALLGVPEKAGCVVVGIAAIGLAGDGEAQLSHVVVERICLLLHAHGFVVPRAHLCGVAFELVGKVGIEGLVLLDGVIGRAQQAPSNKVESLQNLIGNIERQHCQKDDVHQVDHLLTRRDRSFLYGHIDGN